MVLFIFSKYDISGKITSLMIDEKNIRKKLKHRLNNMHLIHKVLED